MNRHPDLKPAFEEIRKHERPMVNQRMLAQQAAAAGLGQHRGVGQSQSQSQVGTPTQSSSSAAAAAALTSAMVGSRPVAITTVGAGRYQFAQQPVQGQFTHQTSEKQQFRIAQPMRVRTLPGDSTVIQSQQQVQPKSHQSDQQWLVTRVCSNLGQAQQHQGQIYSKSNSGSAQQQPVVYTATGGTDTTLLTTTTMGGNVGNSHHHPQQHQVVPHSTRLVPSMNPVVGAAQQRVLGSNAPSTAAVLQLRAAPTRQPQHHQQPQRPILTVMQQSSATKKPSISHQPP